MRRMDLFEGRVINQCTNMSKKIDWQKFQDFQNENKDLLIMIASPKEDGISVSFGGLNTFVKFPGVDMEKGVVFNALRASKFNEAIDAFMTGFIESTGISEKDDGGEVLKVLGGSMKVIGEKRVLKTKKK